MNVVVMVENRPAYRFDKHMFIKASWGTHEDWGCV
jgi:hypothetical protein